MDSECFMMTVNIASNISVIVLHIQYPTKVYNTVTVVCNFVQVGCIPEFR